MKVINLLKAGSKSPASVAEHERVAYVRQFRAISALEGVRTSERHRQLLDDLSTGKLSKADYIKARLKPF